MDNSTDYCGTCNKFHEKDHYAVGKYAGIHGTVAALRKFKRSHPHYRLTENSVRPMCDKYRRTVKSSPATKTITSLKRGRSLMLGSLDKKVKRFLLNLTFKRRCGEYRRSCRSSKNTNPKIFCPYNTLRKSNLLLRLHFGNLPKLLSANVDGT